MATDMNDDHTDTPPEAAQRPAARRFAPPPSGDIPAENFEPDMPDSFDKPYDTYQKPNKHTGRNVFIALLVIILLAGAGAGAYFVFLKPKPVTKTANQAAQTSTAATNAAAAAVPTKHYDSTNFNLGIDYPNTWVLADTSGALTVKSPLQDLPTASGTTLSGKIVLTIQNKQTSLPDFAKGDATAVLASDNVAYTKPTSNQRANTYLSYLQYAATTTSGALDGVYITGDNGYQKGQNVPMSDIVGVDPLVTVTFVSCTDDACAAPKALSVQASSWQANALAKPVKAMLESLAFN